MAVLCDDCTAWGLTNMQSLAYHRRLCSYFAGRAVAYAGRCMTLAWIAGLLALSGMALSVTALVLRSL